MQRVIKTDRAPGAIGPYSQAIEVNGMLYTSGVIPINPATGGIADTIEQQAEQAERLERLERRAEVYRRWQKQAEVGL